MDSWNSGRVNYCMGFSRSCGSQGGREQGARRDGANLGAGLIRIGQETGQYAYGVLGMARGFSADLLGRNGIPAAGLAA
jgi:hypothetical protein